MQQKIQRKWGWLLFGAVILVCGMTVWFRPETSAQSSRGTIQETELETITLPVQRWLVVAAETADKESQFVTVVVPEHQKILVYEVILKDRDRGRLERGALVLRSVRPIHMDIKLQMFNEKEPLPSQIEQMLQR